MRFPKVTANPAAVQIFAGESWKTNRQDKLRRPGIAGETSGCNARAISDRPEVGFLYNGQTSERAGNRSFVPRKHAIGPNSDNQIHKQGGSLWRGAADFKC